MKRAWQVAAILCILSSQGFSNLSLFAALSLPTSNLQSLAFNPAHVHGPGSTTGLVTLTSPAPAGGRTVSLTTASGAFSFPSTVTVAEGAVTATFQLSCVQVSQQYTRYVSATLDGITRTVALSIRPGLKSLSFNPNEVTGGSPSEGLVFLHGGGSSGGATVTLTSGSSAIQVPGTVVIPASAHGKDFPVTTSQVSADYLRLIYASVGGVTRAAYFRITAGPRLANFTINPSTIGGGGSVTGTITLTGPTPSNGRNAKVTDNSSAIVTPAEVTIPSGSTTRNFEINTNQVETAATRQVTVSLGGVTKTASLTLMP